MERRFQGTMIFFKGTLVKYEINVSRKESTIDSTNVLGLTIQDMVFSTNKQTLYEGKW